MKKQLRKALAILCAVAFAFTGITYSPAKVSAADEGWFDATLDWGHYMTDKTTVGDGQGIWDYCGGQAPKAQYKNGDQIEGFTWNTTASGEAIWFETLDLKTINCVSEGGQMVKPQPGVKYKLNMTIDYDSTKTAKTAFQVFIKNGDAPALFEKHYDLNSTNNQVVLEDVELMPEEENPFVFHIGLGVKSNYSGWGGISVPNTFTISDFTLERADSFEPCIMDDDPQSPDYGTFVPAGTPWTVKTQYNGTDLWGKMSYKVEGTASDVASTYLRVDTPAHDDDSEGVDQSDPSKWWWWNSAKLSGYLADAGLDEGRFYKGTMKVEYTSAGTTYDPTLRTIFGGTTMVNALEEGSNTIAIDDFLYEGTANDIEFNLDLLEKGGVMRVTEINLEPADSFIPITKNVKFKTDPSSPWTFEAQNDGATTWGAISYIQGSPAIDPTTTTFRVDTPAHDDATVTPAVDQDDPTDWWWWNSASLINYLSDVAGLEEGYKYKGTIVFDYTRPTGKSGANEYDTPQLRMIENGNVTVIDLVEGENTINIGGDEGFAYNPEYPSIEFNLDLLDKGGILQAKSINFDRADNFEPVTPNVEGGFVPAGTPWNIKVQNNKDTTWGQMSYAVDGTASLVGSTTMRIDNPAHDDDTVTPAVDQDDPDAWWWWNSASLPNYLKNNLVDGRTYTGSMVINYTAPTSPEQQYTPKLRYILNGEVHVVTLEPGENTIAIDSFDYSDVYPNLEFNVDLLEKGSLFQVSNITFTQAPGNWMRVPDNDGDGVDIPVTYDSTMMPSGEVTHTWNLFAGMWEGHGAALYYDNDLSDPYDPLKVKIGAGERWDPACAQIKLTNEDAYQELEDYTNYYMTYTFTSTEKGTLHINHEGYTPTKLTRIDITDDMYDESDGLYHVEFKKIFTYLPDRDDLNLTMFLTPTTYVYNEQTGETDVEMDGEYLPAGTIIANHKIEFTRQDKDGWTLVTDSRDPDHQNYDDIVKDSDQNPILQAYTNSFAYSEVLYSEVDNGRMSYLANQNPDGVDDIAKMGIRLDSTAYSNAPGYTFDNQWANHLRIPNDYFYARPDTNGNYLENGKHYLLRFYINSTAATAQNMGLIMVRQGYDSDQWFRYPVGKGLNLVNGTLRAKKSGRDTDPYIVNPDYTKTGGIEFVYNDFFTTDESFVQFDFSEFPQGTTINDISWEFEAVGYNVFLDGSKTPDNAEPIMEGDTYTFPEVPGVIGYQDDYDPQKVYRPGEQVPYDQFTDDIYATSITGYKVTIVDTDGNPIKVDYVDPGDPYNFPSVDDPDFKDFKEYKDDDNTYHNGDTIPAVNQDYTFVAVPKGNYIVTVQTPDGQVLRQTPVEEGGTYTFPSDIEGVQDYTYNGQTYNKGDTMGPVNENRTVIANPVPVTTHTVSIVDAKDPTHVLLTATVDDGDNYELPTISGLDLQKYVWNNTDYQPGQEIGPITKDEVVKAYEVPYYKISIDGVKVADIRDGSNYTFPSGQDAAKIGYISVNGGPVLDPGSSVGPIHEDRDYLSIDEIGLTPQMGASMLLNQAAVNPRGIGFGADFSIYDKNGNLISFKDHTEVYKSESFKLGTMICTYSDYVDKFNETLDLETVAQDTEKRIRNIMNNYTFCDQADPTTNFATYRAGIVNLNDYNIPRDFIARSYGYVETASGAVSDVTYANYSDIRSIKTVATNLMKNPNWKTVYPEPWKQEIIEYCAAFEG